MTDQKVDFRRIVIELSRGHHDERSLRFLAEFAGIFGIELSARYLVDPGPMQAAALPFGREFRMLEQAWSPLDQQATAHAAELSMSAARRRFEKVAGAQGVVHSFQLLTGNEPVQAREARRDQSILALSPASSGAQPFELLLKAAFEEAMGVLLLPARTPRKEGRILVVAEREDAALSGIGSRVAEHLKQQLVTMEPTFRGAHDTAVAGRDHSKMGESPGLAGQARERLIVVRRGLLDENAMETLVSRRGAVVLAVDQ